VSTVAVVGLGGMGSRVAGRLLNAGHDLVVWNRSTEKMEPLKELGAAAATTPADAARRAEAVITMVADPDSLREVTEGRDGVAAGEPDTLIQMTTVSIEATRRLEPLFPRLLDAPVLGSLTEVEAGTLKVFAAGPDELVERWRPLLSVLGEVIRVGPVGAGTAAKLVANSTLLGVLTVLGEALALAKALGLSQEAAFEVLSATPVAAQAERRRQAVETDEYPRRFALALAQKDAELIREAAQASGVELKAAAAAREWFAEATEAGWDDKDYSAILAWIQRPT
jgi:3-hydroxyisobutyrate dehydrogenase-like beta-hydroxyacid dehydrogenase